MVIQIAVAAAKRRVTIRDIAPEALKEPATLELAQRVYRRFINALGEVHIDRDTITVRFPKRAHNPLLFEAGFRRETVRVLWLHDRILRFEFG